MSENVGAHVIVSGKVQGVFFRLETRRTSERNQVTGWVRNLADGTVEALIEGPEPAVEAVIDWCRQGPPLARVKRVIVTPRDYSGQFSQFDITT